MTRSFLDRRIALPFGTAPIREILKSVEESHPVPHEKRDSVGIIAGALKEIAHDSIKEALVYLDCVEAAIPSLAMDFHVSPDPEAFQNLLQLYEGLYWLNALLDKLNANFQMSLEHMFVQGVPVPEHHHRFISILKRLIELQENGNFTMIPDLLRNEIALLIPVWREMFDIISNKVNEAQ